MPADLNDYFNNQKKSNDPKNKLNILIYAIIFIVGIFVVFKPFVIIQSGEVGIKSVMGVYEKNCLNPGIHFYIPYVEEIYPIDTRVRIINYTNDQNDEVKFANSSGIITKNSISVLDARNLPVSIDLTIQYKLNDQNVPQTITNWGFAWEDKIINPVVLDVVRNVVGKYTAEELPTKRNEIANLIDTNISKIINNLPNKPVEIKSVQLREIILPAKVKEQIERVQIAKQEAERTRYEVERANQEAQKRAALASGAAKAIEIEAKAKANAIKIEADAQAYANNKIKGSLDERILRLKEIKTQAKFNEALRDNKNANIFLTPGGVVPNLWVNPAKKEFIPTIINHQSFDNNTSVDNNQTIN